MYYDEIDPIGESDIQENCLHCDAPDISYHGYCSKSCYNYDTE